MVFRMENVYFCLFDYNICYWWLSDAKTEQITQKQEKQKDRKKKKKTECLHKTKVHGIFRLMRRFEIDVCAYSCHNCIFRVFYHLPTFVVCVS